MQPVPLSDFSALLLYYLIIEKMYDLTFVIIEKVYNLLVFIIEKVYLCNRNI